MNYIISPTRTSTYYTRIYKKNVEKKRREEKSNRKKRKEEKKKRTKQNKIRNKRVKARQYKNKEKYQIENLFRKYKSYILLSK